MKPCFGYIRVSTQKQGEGVSLEAQKDAITVFASQNNLTVTQWFEEKETAAKQGRPVFIQMLRQLKRGKAVGLIMHKIDRSARNPRDWADISDLSDAGIDIHFATENLDFRSRGGRLTADIQAVIAADYIRNLREECIKGMTGRLKQGIFPWGAPPGYLNQGGGKPKIPCPKTAPLIRLTFELYATGQYSYESLLDEMHRRCLRNTRGGRLTLCGLGNILQNPFYIGLMYIKSSGKTYEGIHEPIVPVATWNRVQTIRNERSGPKSTRHNHLFQGIFRCGLCDNPMVPERQKDHVYYRCKRQNCPTKTIREEVLDEAIRTELRQLELSSQASVQVSNAEGPATLVSLEDQRSAIALQIKDEERRLERLEDLLIDDTLSSDTFTRKKAMIQVRLAELREKHAQIPDPSALVVQQEKLAELRNSLVFLYESANRAEKRMIVENVWPNRTVSGKKPAFEPYSWITRVKNDVTLLGGAHERDRDRTSTAEGDSSPPEKLFPLLDRSLRDDTEAA
ncbi:recombinase family protein [Maritimibacter sp. 55A14]|uniref:recombinase family protein n=1 Tax=Maritimibacter sp. 55A14 TaxID=2174844 RepID=UPI000D6156B7|nr:recombinase family protein [Maritimibacter sp. 55A14]PWE34088.1 recombinase family protein [Maritimibacter sp. 55A14]